MSAETTPPSFATATSHLLPPVKRPVVPLTGTDTPPSAWSETVQRAASPAPALPLPPAEEPVKAKRGRPKGTKNKPKEDVVPDDANLMPAGSGVPLLPPDDREPDSKVEREYAESDGIKELSSAILYNFNQRVIDVRASLVEAVKEHLQKASSQLLGEVSALIGARLEQIELSAKKNHDEVQDRLTEFEEAIAKLFDYYAGQKAEGEAKEEIKEIEKEVQEEKAARQARTLGRPSHIPSGTVNAGTGSIVVAAEETVEDEKEENTQPNTSGVLAIPVPAATYDQWVALWDQAQSYNKPVCLGHMGYLHGDNTLTVGVWGHKDGVQFAAYMPVNGKVEWFKGDDIRGTIDVLGAQVGIVRGE